MATKLDVAKPTGRGVLPDIPTRRRWLVALGVIVLFLLAGTPIMSAGAKLDSIQRNDAEVYLPTNSETTKAIEANKAFSPLDSTTVVLVYTRPDGGPITSDDRTKVA